jgi:hypothetical protein
MSEWTELDLWVDHDFDQSVYQTFITNLERDIFNLSDMVVTRHRIETFRERSRKLIVCKINGKRDIELNLEFYLKETWQRDIEGWQMLENSCSDEGLKEWFFRFKERAKAYQTASILELTGGPPVEYDFSSSREGPFHET